MSTFPMLPLFTDAFIADTGHLTAHETGAYLMLLMVAWRIPECRLPDDDAKLARWSRVGARAWQRTKPAVMAFWTLKDGFWTQKRLLLERAKTNDRAQVARNNGMAGGRPPKAFKSGIFAYSNSPLVAAEFETNPLGNNNPQNPEGFQNITQKKASISISTEEDANASLSETSSDTLAEKTPKRRKRVSYPPDFEAFWTAFPTDALMSKKAAGLVWSRMTEDVRQLAMASLPAFRAYCTSKPDYRPVHAVRYLTQERFVGFSEVVSKAAGKVFVAKGTPQWTAWQRVQHSSCVTSAEHRQDGWWFESEWPNGSHVDERKTA